MPEDQKRRWEDPATGRATCLEHDGDGGDDDNFSISTWIEAF
jgi:hypothetical protein